MNKGDMCEALKSRGRNFLGSTQSQVKRVDNPYIIKMEIQDHQVG